MADINAVELKKQLQKLIPLIDPSKNIRQIAVFIKSRIKALKRARVIITATRRRTKSGWKINHYLIFRLPHRYLVVIPFEIEQTETGQEFLWFDKTNIQIVPDEPTYAKRYGIRRLDFILFIDIEKCPPHREYVARVSVDVKEGYKVDPSRLKALIVEALKKADCYVLNSEYRIAQHLKYYLSKETGIGDFVIEIHTREYYEKLHPELGEKYKLQGFEKVNIVV